MKAGDGNICSLLLASSPFHEFRPHCSFRGVQKEPVVCPQCGSESRVKPGLCLSCLLSQGLSEETSMEASQNGKGQNGETLEDVTQ